MKNKPAILIHYIQSDSRDIGECLSINKILLFRNAETAKKFVNDYHKTKAKWNSWYSYEYTVIERTNSFEKGVRDTYNLYEKDMMTKDSIQELLKPKKYFI